MNIYYVIKDYTEHDFSNVWKTKKTDHGLDWFLELVAEEIADNHYYEDPCRPEDFECIVGVKRNLNDKPNWYSVSAQQSVHFSVEEYLEDQ